MAISNNFLSIAVSIVFNHNDPVKVNLTENALSPQQEQGVSVRIADQQSRTISRERHGSARDKAHTRCRKPALECWHIVDLKREPRRRNVVAGQRRRSASRWA